LRFLGVKSQLGSAIEICETANAKQSFASTECRKPIRSVLQGETPLFSRGKPPFPALLQLLSKRLKTGHAAPANKARSLAKSRSRYALRLLKQKAA
jgi:hypothetical protein